MADPDWMYADDVESKPVAREEAAATWAKAARDRENDAFRFLAEKTPGGNAGADYAARDAQAGWTLAMAAMLDAFL
jgi:hypothetical protein